MTLSQFRFPARLSLEKGCAALRLGIALSAALAAGGAYAAKVEPSFRCSARDEWREYRSKHFLVTTDASRFEATALIKELETLHALELQALLGEQVEIPGRSRVIAFGDERRFKGMAGSYYVSGYSSVSRRLDERIIVLPVAGFKADPETVAHELAHHLSWFLFPRQPRWFSEGLAMFVQTVVNRDSDNAPAIGSHMVRGDRGLGGGVGLMPRYLMDQLRGAGSVPVKELLDWRGREDVESPGRYHAWSWLLYHWLWNNRSKELTDFQKRLSDAQDPALAWRTALPEFDPAKPGALAKLDETLGRYSRSARYGFYRVSAKADTAFTDTPLRCADVRALVLASRMSWPDEKEARMALLRAELDEALREDPTQPVAIAWRAQLDQESPLPALRKAAVSRAGDWRFWVLLGNALSGETEAAEREAAYRKAVELNPDSASAQNGLARALENSGHTKEALRAANRAADLAPWDPLVLDTLAGVAVRLEKCPEALTLQHRAVDLLPPTQSSGEDLRKRLEQYESRCGSTDSRTR